MCYAPAAVPLHSPLAPPDRTTATATTAPADGPLVTRVLLVGHYGRNNLGDDAMLEGIRRTIPDGVRLTVLAGRPLPQLRTAPERPWAFVQQLVRNDWIWFGGGTHIHDLGDNPRFVNRGPAEGAGPVRLCEAPPTQDRLHRHGSGTDPLPMDPPAHWLHAGASRLLERAGRTLVRGRQSMHGTTPGAADVRQLRGARSGKPFEPHRAPSSWG